MARPLRIEYRGAGYHVTARSNWGGPLIRYYPMSGDDIFMKGILLFLVCSSICLSAGGRSAREASAPPPEPLFPDDPKGTNLPVGVPRMVDTNGNVISIDHEFTTPQYRRAAGQWLLQEANRVAEQMRLPNEVLPITQSNLTKLFIPPFGFSCIFKSVGLVGTSNYVYMCSKDNKFCGLAVVDYDQVCLKLESTLLPLKQMDTNAAFQLAINWLAKASVDVVRLNRDCKGHVAVSPYWNGLSKPGQIPRKSFVPIYYVWWTTSEYDAQGFGDIACAELFLPTKELIQLLLPGGKYNLNKPFVMTNPASLFPGTGRVTILPKARDPGGVDLTPPSIPPAKPPTQPR